MTAQEISSKLQIVSLKGKRFACPGGYYAYTKGHALYHPELGYLAWNDEPHEPYTPPLSALKSILDAGGLVDYSLNTWIKSL